MNRNCIIVAAISATALLQASVAIAQGLSSEVEGVIGLGVGSAPTFAGSDQTENEVLPIIDLEWRRFFLNSELGVGGYFLRRDDDIAEYGVALSLGYDFDSREQDDDSRLSGLDDVEGTATINAIFEYGLGPADLEFVISRGIGGDGHGGTTATLSAGFDTMLGERLQVGVAPFVRWADGDYTDAFYGVSASEAGRSSFSRYDASSGIERYGIEVSGYYRLNERVGIAAEIELGRLSGDAADSPLVFDDTQIEVGIGLLYSF